MRKFRTVDAARIAAKVSRGTWDNVEKGKPIKDFSLAAIEEALDWPAGHARAILTGEALEASDDYRGPGRLSKLINTYVAAHPTTTNADIAAAVGVSPSTISRWRTQRQSEIPTPPEVLSRLAEFIDRTDEEVWYAVGWDTGYIVEHVVDPEPEEVAGT